MSAEHSTYPIDYRQLPECEGYRFTSDGFIETSWRNSSRLPSSQWQRLEPYARKSGHLRTCIKINGKSKTVDVAPLICKAFHGPCPPGLECCHEDGNPANNVPTNLRWDTRLENIRDSIRHGTKARGDRNGQSRLTEEQVKKVIELRHLGPRKLGRMFGVAHATISCILRGINWKWVDKSPT